jgi:N-acylneuraminate cytidylyltransferase
VIPARGGSKGLPGKAVKLFVGLPLIAHSIKLAEMSPLIDECIISTDSNEIADVARAHGGNVPFMRPPELALDDSPMWPTLRHALLKMEEIENRRFQSLLLLDPTSPGRTPEDIAAAIALLDADPQANGVVAVSEPHFNPRWVCVEERDGYMTPSFDSKAYTRRQDVPVTYRINALLYLWRRDFLINHVVAPAMEQARYRMLILPEDRAIHIDELRDFKAAEYAVRSGDVRLPWITTPPEGRSQS